MIQEKWWGTYEIPPGRQAHWRIGPLQAWAERIDKRWRISSYSSEEYLDTKILVDIPCEYPPDTAYTTENDFVVKDSPADTITLSPASPDRPVVSRPEKAFYLLPRERIEVYLSIPLWIRFETKKKGRIITELPFFRPSDTWFGPSPMTGELSYASITPIYSSLDQVPPLPHRAITQVKIINLGADPLFIEKMNIPVRHLSVYASSKGQLWMDSVSIYRDIDEKSSAVKITSTTRREGMALIQKPRDVRGDNIITKAFGSLFGQSFAKDNL